MPDGLIDPVLGGVPRRLGLVQPRRRSRTGASVRCAPSWRPPLNGSIVGQTYKEVSDMMWSKKACVALVPGTIVTLLSMQCRAVDAEEHVSAPTTWRVRGVPVDYLEQGPWRATLWRNPSVSLGTQTGSWRLRHPHKSKNSDVSCTTPYAEDSLRRSG